MVGNLSGNHEPRPEWMQAHDALSSLAKQRAGLDAEECRWFLCAMRSAVHVHLGYGSFAEYIERLFGYRPRSTREKLRVAEALETLPKTAAALRDGQLSYSAVRELTRVATSANERAWLDVARGKTARQLEALTAGKAPGDHPNAPSRPDKLRHVLRFEVSAETLSLMREAIERVRRQANAALDDDAALLAMARHVLGGPNDDGRSSYQIALTVCEECGRGRQQAGSELVAVGPQITEMAECDAQHLGSVGGSVGAGASAAHVSQRPTPARATARATQSIPPRIRRAVLCRDGHCCVVPGCRNTRFVDLHHLELRSEGGDHDLDNLVTLCGAHHRALHRGELVIQGSVSRGLLFVHADGTTYGSAPSPHSVDAGSKTFRALVSMGFREADARRALSKLPATDDVKRLLRAALLELTPRAGAGEQRRSGSS